MKNNCYNKDNNIGNSILFIIIVLYIVYILLYIFNVSSFDASYNYDTKVNDEKTNIITSKVQNYVIDAMMSDTFKMKDEKDLHLEPNADKINSLLLNELKYMDIDIKENINNDTKDDINNSLDKTIDTSNINETKNQFKDDINDIYNDNNVTADNDNENLNVNIESEKVNHVNLNAEKKEMISVLNSKDESLKMTAISKMFTFETNIRVAKDLYDYAKILSSTDNKVDLLNKKILIFHTHSQEGFKDTTDLKTDGIVGMGEELAKVLREKYKLNVIHYTGEHDITNGMLNREGSYERIEESIKEILIDDTDIEVLIDLHRDGVPESRRLVTDINGKKCAQIMLVNGICKLVNDGTLEDIDYLPNDYINDNFNLSMNMQIAADKLYPDISRKILVKPYRYSLHMKPNSMLIELGAQNNTVEEVKNTIPHLAEIIYTALTNKNDKL